MKKRSYKLAASLVCADMLNLASEVKALEKAGVEYIHFDVMDGSFVPRLGLHPEMLSAVKAMTKIPIDVHLMIDHPEEFVQIFSEAGADIITVHAESTKHLHRVLKKIRTAGLKAGVALNPSTPLEVLDYVIDDIDLVLLMAINPGIVGHKLIPVILKKISDLKKKLANRSDIIIEIDGGVTFDSAAEMVHRGASMLVCGNSTIFKPPAKVDQKIAEFRTRLDHEI